MQTAALPARRRLANQPTAPTPPARRMLGIKRPEETGSGLLHGDHNRLARSDLSGTHFSIHRLQRLVKLPILT